MKVMIATPTTRHTVHDDYADSLVALVVSMMRAGIHTMRARQDGASVTFQRDILAYRFLEESDATHMLFVDSDMKFPPDIGERLLSYGKDFIAAMCPKKRINVRRISEALKRGASPDTAAIAALEFVGVGKIDKVGDLYRLPAIGTGIALISRKCFDLIRERAPPDQYVNTQYRGKRMYRFFGEFLSPDGELQTEDVSFCRRYTSAGGEIWGYPSAKIGHVGTFVYEASFDDWVEAIGQAREPTSTAAE